MTIPQSDSFKPAVVGTGLWSTGVRTGTSQPVSHLCPARWAASPARTTGPGRKADDRVAFQRESFVCDSGSHCVRKSVIGVNGLRALAQILETVTVGYRGKRHGSV